MPKKVTSSLICSDFIALNTFSTRVFIPLSRRASSAMTMTTVSNFSAQDKEKYLSPLEQRLRKKEETRLSPMGSNYDLIFPEIGVRVTEGKKNKGGSKEFGKKYNKTSNADYDRYLNEFIPNLNRTRMKSE